MGYHVRFCKCGIRLCKTVLRAAAIGKIRTTATFGNANTMWRIALKMLFNDQAKYIGLVIGVAYSTLLINQQMGIFLGLLSRGGALIDDIPEANVWVMDPGVKNLDTVFPMRYTELGRVRGVEGAQWAVPYFKSMATIRTQSGQLESALLVGADDQSMIGIPANFVLGTAEDFRKPDAVAVNEDGFGKVWKGEKISIGNTVELNDRRAIVVAIIKDSPKFTSSITFYTRYSQALSYTNNGRNQMSFLLVRTAPQYSVKEVSIA